MRCVTGVNASHAVGETSGSTSSSALVNKKFKRESVRVRVVAIANLTLQLERMTEGVIEGGDGKLVRKANYDHEGRPRTLIYREGDPERIIHIIGQIQNLLRALGIKDDD
jgi:hypothetical protein